MNQEKRQKQMRDDKILEDREQRGKVICLRRGACSI
jgi:hypothetical protein